MRASGADNQRLLLIFSAVLAVFYRALEILDAFAKTLPEIGELARPKNKQRDRQQNQQLRDA